jgi:hypothetical protein
MIESKERIVFGNHLIEIGKGSEYGKVRVSITNNYFKVEIEDQNGYLIKQDTYPIKRNLTPDEQAFMDSYSSNVADAPPEVVEAFIRAEDHDQFCQEYGNEYYSGLADAHGVWYDALTYARGRK